MCTCVLLGWSNHTLNAFKAVEIFITGILTDLTNLKMQRFLGKHANWGTKSIKTAKLAPVKQNREWELLRVFAFCLFDFFCWCLFLLNWLKYRASVNFCLMYQLQITHRRNQIHMLWNQILCLNKKRMWKIAERDCVIKGFRVGTITVERVNGGNLGIWLSLTFSKRSFHPQHPSLSTPCNDGLPAEEMRCYLLITVLPQ